MDEAHYSHDCRVLQKRLELLLLFPPTDVREAVTSWYERYEEVICRPTVRQT